CWEPLGYTLIAAPCSWAAGIGVYFQRISRHTDNNDDFVLGGRALAPFPVALSILATFTSALSLMGIPADVYMYGKKTWSFPTCFSSWLRFFATISSCRCSLVTTSLPCTR
ncbi:hypothetical protein JTE90_000038, partial [Oedothorax gibbosus]